MATIPIYLVVWRCMECESITAIDTAWQLRYEADKRLAELDKSQTNEKTLKLLSEIIQVVAP